MSHPETIAKTNTERDQSSNTTNVYNIISSQLSFINHSRTTTRSHIQTSRFKLAITLHRKKKKPSRTIFLPLPPLILLHLLITFDLYLPTCKTLSLQTFQFQTSEILIKRNGRKNFCSTTSTSGQDTQDCCNE